MEPIRVLLADDHILFRKGLASLVAAQADVEVVGEAADGLEALQKARELKPDIILMDIHMPNCDGIKATRLIKTELPNVRIVMLTVSDEDEDLFEAIKSGAQGYLLKNLRPETLFDMLRGTMQGEAPISPVMATKILGEFAQRTQKKEGAVPTAALTGREREILAQVVNGISNKEIAGRLFITEGTVKNHLHNILEKLHLENRVQAATYALREGIVESS